MLVVLRSIDIDSLKFALAGLGLRSSLPDGAVFDVGTGASVGPISTFESPSKYVL